LSASATVDDAPGLSDLLPAGAIAVEERGEPPPPPLDPRDAALPAAAPRRLAEFARGRACAHAALVALGLDGPIGRGADRAPRWPAGAVGSITHCAGYVAAAVARADRVRALGLDAEPAAPLPPGVLTQIASPTERAHLATLPTDQPWDRLLFAIKESVYKAWAPATGRWLDFTDAEVTIDPTAGRFRAALAVDGPWRLLDGRFAASAGLWLAVTAIAASALTDPIGPTAA
jgi:4'-phosphopantetheinyl transferase EntD